MAKPVRKSPILGAVSSMIDEASGRLVTVESKFRHSFEADIRLIDPDPAQPRRTFDADDLQGLAATLQTEGQLQPVLLRRHPQDSRRWMIVAGERRWRAAQMLNWTHLLAIEHQGDGEIATLVENIQRKDLSPVEEAYGLARLIQAKHWTQDQLANAVGKTKSEVSSSLKILSLPDTILNQVLTSELVIAKNVLVEIARIDNAAIRAQLAELAIAQGLTVRQVRALLAEMEVAATPTEEAAPSPALESVELVVPPRERSRVFTSQQQRAVRRLIDIVNEETLTQHSLPDDLLAELARLRDLLDHYLRHH
jgi:ParB family chromosome partitioning protein